MVVSSPAHDALRDPVNIASINAMRCRDDIQNQLDLSLRPPRRWGGRRAGAGRRPSARPIVPHRSRSSVRERHPCHVTLRVRRGIPSLRSGRLVRAFRCSLADACERPGFRVVHFSLQSNQVHLLVEARGARELGRGMKAVGSRLARAANRIFSRQGPVLAERYHLRVLQTPREVRNALAYVLLNARKHWAERVGAGAVSRPAARLDPASSAPWFDGWCDLSPRAPSGSAGVARARSWLLSVGWKRRGLIDPSEVPGQAGP